MQSMPCSARALRGKRPGSRVGRKGQFHAPRGRFDGHRPGSRLGCKGQRARPMMAIANTSTPIVTVTYLSRPSARTLWTVWILWLCCASQYKDLIAETESIKLAPVDCRHLALFWLEPLPLIELAPRQENRVEANFVSGVVSGRLRFGPDRRPPEAERPRSVSGSVVRAIPFP